MNPCRPRARRSVTLTASVLTGIALLAGCVGVRTEGEQRAGRDQQAIGIGAKKGSGIPVGRSVGVDHRPIRVL